ncbi:hypothetical protein [Streptomyces sp. NPDC057702]|uniref:hypothetical protein n=1 Tax=unclassified Streptomyces TaxID=2593676 RepID=UPI0036B0874A
MPGAVEALAAVRSDPHLLPTVVTGNPRGSAEIKLKAFGLDRYGEVGPGGYASDGARRPALVGIARRRAAAAYGHAFDRHDTVIITR